MKQLGSAAPEEEKDEQKCEQTEDLNTESSLGQRIFHEALMVAPGGSRALSQNCRVWCSYALLEGASSLERQFHYRIKFGQIQAYAVLNSLNCSF